MSPPNKNLNKSIPSYKDPNGFVFEQGDEVLRRVNRSYFVNYDHLKKGGLYEHLIKQGLLIPHTEISKNNDFMVIKPVKIPFISYPYEWSFSELKDAALLTLKIQKTSLNFKMTLKDANGFNVQFLEGKPIFIDTLSFDKYRQGDGWIGYRQFCMFFLGPLLLMSKVDLRSNKFLQIFIDGLPLDFVSSMLPKSSWLNFGALLNIHIHSRSEKKFSQVTLNKQKKSVSLNSILGLIDNLEGLISNLKTKQTKTTWGDYYNNTNYTPKAFKSKKSITAKFLNLSKPNKVWDFGANNGVFSRLVSSNSQVISFDNDPLAIDQNYNYNKEQNIKNCLPLIMDLTNVSPSIGWNLKERLSLMERGPTDLVMFLALIHHLVISNNLSFELIVNFLSRITKKLIIEFIPKSDSQVEKLLKNREDIFLEYNPVQFEKSFSEKFKIIALQKVTDSKRVIYLMEKKND